MDIVDLNNCRYSIKNGTYLGKSCSKDGIIYLDREWMIKYVPKIKNNVMTGEPNYSEYPLNEYIGSHIFGILGYDVHETILGERNNRIVVACSDFTGNGKLLTIRSIKNHQNKYLLERDFNPTSSKLMVDLDELLLHFKYNDILKNVAGLSERFWEQAIVDIFINNSNRNNENWGVLRDNQGKDSLAPVFANGACLQSKISVNEIENASNIQTPYGLNGRLLSAREFLKLFLDEKVLRNASIKVIPNIMDKIDKIHNLIDSIPNEYTGVNRNTYTICSENRKKLYHIQLQSRLDNLLIPHLRAVEEYEVTNHNPDIQRKHDADNVVIRKHGR